MPSTAQADDAGAAQTAIADRGYNTNAMQWRCYRYKRQTMSFVSAWLPFRVFRVFRGQICLLQTTENVVWARERKRRFAKPAYTNKHSGQRGGTPRLRAGNAAGRDCPRYP